MALSLVRILFDLHFSYLLAFLCVPTTLLVTAAPQPKCYLDDWCEVDGDLMQEAISLIPAAVSFPTTRQLRPDAYHVPAIFEASDKAQILVRILSMTGVTLDAETLMTHLWPSAKQQATQLLEDCVMDGWGFSGKIEPVIQWGSGLQRKTLKYRLDMTCEIDRAGMYSGPGIGVTTYSALGIGVSRVSGRGGI